MNDSGIPNVGSICGVAISNRNRKRVNYVVHCIGSGFIYPCGRNELETAGRGIDLMSGGHVVLFQLPI
jgi:hypothetical protein